MARQPPVLLLITVSLLFLWLCHLGCALSYTRSRRRLICITKHLLRGCVVRTERTNGAPDDGASVVSYDGLSRRRQPQSQFTLHGQPAAGIGKDNGHDALDREQVHQARVCWTRSLSSRFSFSCKRARWGKLFSLWCTSAVCFPICINNKNSSSR